ncbi:MAG: hypothetical protein KBG40_04390 [Bacteroidales bacterium]|nr:hypothetical protein [Bacteroidales bacterium]
MKIVVFKTHEISSGLWLNIINEFDKAFNVRKNVEEFINYYKHTVLGYSYHVIAFDEQNNLAGYNALYPAIYYDNIKEKNILIGISGGTFVVKEYRKDIFIFSDMIKSLLEYACKEGIVATLGVSNENSFKYALNFLESKLISYLPYYALPVRIFNILNIRSLKFLNFISVFFIHVFLILNNVLSNLINSLEKKARFEIVTDENFYFNRFYNNKYRKVNFEDIFAYYSIVEEREIKTVYLFDFRENGKRSYKSLVKTVRYILKVEKPDIILFIGYLRLKQFILIRVPWKIEPQHLPLTLNLTSFKHNLYLESMLKKENWNFGLMNFDVR